jgi:hypothetical protein
MSGQRLLGVMSCQKEAKHRLAILETWGKEMPSGWDLKFFVGASNWIPETDPKVLEFIGPPGTLSVMHPTKAETPKEAGLWAGVEPLDCPDSYLGTAWKGKAIQRYAKEHGYDGLFLACCDTLVNPSMLHKATVGDCSAQVFRAAAAKAYPRQVPCPHGGYGYWLSRKALEAIYDEPVRHYSEDQSTAFALHHVGIRLINNRVFANNRLIGGYWIVGTVSHHLSTKAREFKPEDIRNAWNESKRRMARYPDWDGVCKKCGGVAFKLGFYGPQCTGCGNRRPMCV